MTFQGARVSTIRRQLVCFGHAHASLSEEEEGGVGPTENVIPLRLGVTFYARALAVKEGQVEVRHSAGSFATVSGSALLWK